MAGRFSLPSVGVPAKAFWDRYYWYAQAAVLLLALATQYPWPPGDLATDGLFLLWTLAGYLAARRYPFAARLVHALGVLPILAFYARRPDTAFPPELHPFAYLLLAFFPIYTATAMAGGRGFAAAALLAWALGAPFLDRAGWVALAFFSWSLTGLVALGYYRLAEQIRVHQRGLEALVLADPLTGLRNRRALEEDFAHLQALARREGKPLVLTLWDVNNLKAINDTYGHQAGDRVLKKFARVLKDTVRQSDSLYRLGGDEFAGLHIGLAAPEQLLERVRRRFPWASAGWIDAGGLSFEEAYRRADRALYRDKAHKPDDLARLTREETVP